MHTYKSPISVFLNYLHLTLKYLKHIFIFSIPTSIQPLCTHTAKYFWGVGLPHPQPQAVSPQDPANLRSPNWLLQTWARETLWPLSWWLGEGPWGSFLGLETCEWTVLPPLGVLPGAAAAILATREGGVLILRMELLIILRMQSRKWQEQVSLVNMTKLLK